MDADIVIVGAGPSGLCMAQSLTGQGLRIAMIEKQSLEALASPAFDGREIALTQQSVKTLTDLGVWPRIDPQARSPLMDAKILDGKSPFEMVISHQLTHHHELGWLVSNHLIRKAAYEAVKDSMEVNSDITLIAGQQLTHIDPQADRTVVTLDNGQTLSAKLVIAADSRFSATRRLMGIAADMHDCGRNMLVCCMTHQVPHLQIAWEWFNYGLTLALLPMNPDPLTQELRSSVVITAASVEIDALLQASTDRFNAQVEGYFENRLGRMNLVSSKHAYPLVSVYPKSLVGPRFATVGDAAVGMHPVTAHGFNFGLLGVKTLSQEIHKAKVSSLDIAHQSLLDRYNRIHQWQTRPLYLLTRLIAEVYTRESPPAKLLRKALLRIGGRLTPLKRSIAASLTGTA